MTEQLGLVLGGGGSRGAYQIGVWEALREQGISPDIVTGTSVGALNGAVMVQDDFERARQMWLHLTTQDVANVDTDSAEESPSPDRAVFLEFLRQVVLAGGVDIGGLESVMREVVCPPRFYASPIEYGLVTVRYPTFEPVTLAKRDIPPEKLCDYLIASASCFPSFPAREIDGAKFIDGAYYDNLPVNLAVELGAARVIAVDIEGIGLRKRTRERGIPLTLIRPSHPLGQTLRFSPELAERNMRLGYLDALRALHAAEGDFITLEPGTAALLHARLCARLQEGCFLLGRQGLDSPDRFAKAMQQLAEWYELDCLPLYTPHTYCYELLLRFNASAPLLREEVADTLRVEGVGLGGRLRRFGKQLLVGHLYELMRQASFGGEDAMLRRMAAALQDETAAALLLFALKGELADENAPALD